MTRSQLPQNYIFQNETIINDCEDILQWSSSTATLSMDTEDKKYGTKSLVASNISTDTAINYYPSSSISLNESISFWVFMPSDKSDTINMFGVYLHSSSGKYYEYFMSISTLKVGWNLVVVNLTDFKRTGMASWGSIYRVNFFLKPNTNKTINGVKFDKICFGRKEKPKIIIISDDGWANMHSMALPILQNSNSKINIAVNKSAVNNTPNYMTVSQLNDFKNNGHCIINHGATHMNLQNKTYEQVYNEVKDNKDFMISNGWIEGADYFCYPFGDYTDDTILQALKDNNIKFGRLYSSYSGNREISHCDYLTGDDFLKLGVLATTNANTVISYIEDIKKTGGTLIWTLHNVDTEQASLKMAISDFEKVIKFIDVSNIDCITVVDWYEGLTNPRKQVNK